MTTYDSFRPGPAPARWFALPLLALLVLTGCWRAPAETTATAADLTWPDGVAYEIFVQSFADADGDGIGDFRGLTSRLDYLEELGIRAVWLMPIGPSPSYHKYDVTDYRDVHPDYGTLDDFKAFVREAHARDIAVIIDLVVNHSSREHPWFQQAAADTASPYRDYYVWATPDEVAALGATKEAAADSDNRQAWHEVEGSDELYYGYFGGHMPDLNFDSPAVRQEIVDIGRFWLEDVGVDGFRLDAARHIFTDDRAPDNHAWWVEFREAMEAVRPDVYLVGEVWAPSDVVAPYLKGLTALFNFDLGYAITRAARDETADSLVHRLQQIRNFYTSVDSAFLDATFITNHDQNRIMSEVDGDPNRARMAAALLLTLPGSPYLYYGEELGMQGRKPDEYIREPFLWGGADTTLQARWIEARYSTPETVAPATVQAADARSLLNHYKTFIHLRNESEVLTKGDLVPADPAPESVVSFLRTHEGDTLWVVHNLSAAPATFTVPAAAAGFTTERFESRDGVTLANGSLQLPPYSTGIFAAP